MPALLKDLGYALRLARKSPGFTLLAMICLGLGIGVNTAVFSMLNYLFFRPLPVREPDRLVVVGRAASQLLSWPDYHDLQAGTRLRSDLAASNPTESSLDFDGETHVAAAEAVTANYANVIGVRPFMGRWFDRDDEPAAVIGYRTWQRLFHGDPRILGKRVRSESRWYTIVGVAPAEFAGIYLPLNMDIWVPFQTWAGQYPDLAGQLENRDRPRVFVFGRLKPGVTALQAAAESNAMAARFAKSAGDPLVIEVVRGVPNARSRRTSVPIAAVLLTVVGIILLIACVNVGNLLLARGAARAREISTRIALGAGRSRIVRQLTTESLCLALGGGLVGLALGAWAARGLEILLPATAFGETLRLDLAPDARVMGWAMLLALCTTVVFGLAPAWRASRTDILPILKGGAPTSVRRRLRNVSVVAQVALSMVLLLTAGLFLRVLFSFHAADPGFAIEDHSYITALASPPEFTAAASREFYVQALARLRALPGVRSAAVANLLPLTPVNPDCVSLPDGEKTVATTSAVSAGYLETMHIPLVAGRDFAATDLPSGAPMAIVNETLARRFWPGRSPAGKRLVLGCHNPVSLEVVGVARDARAVSLGEAPTPHVYRDFVQDPEGVQNIIVETLPGAPLPPEILRKTVAAGGPAARIYGSHPLREWVDRSYWQVRWEVSMLVALGLLALSLAALGLYGVLAYYVTLRTHEVGIRLAVGANSTDVLRMMLRQGLGMALVGVFIGMIACAVVARAIRPLLYGVGPADPITYAIVSLVWLFVAVAACYWPARRASRLNPILALRHE